MSDRQTGTHAAVSALPTPTTLESPDPVVRELSRLRRQIELDRQAHAEHGKRIAGYEQTIDRLSSEIAELRSALLTLAAGIETIKGFVLGQAKAVG